VIGAERFLQEIRVTAHLQHPHILPLFDSGEADSFLFYVMPYLEGESLRERLTREKQLPVDEAIEITRAAATALDYAHRHKVIHRDIKPENILVEDGQTVVADFGIELAVTAAGGDRLTETGLSLGTPQYMSPEQATADRELDGRSDIYSLACVLYEMLTGDPPHTGNTVQAIIAKVLTDQPRRLCLCRPSVPAHVEAAVHQALAKLPADRFATAAHFAEALTRPEVPAPLQEPTVPFPGRAPAARPARRLAATGGAIAIGVALILGGVSLDRWLGRARSSGTMVARLQVPLPGQQLAGIAGADLALSRDGTQLGIVTTGETGRGLNVRSLDQLALHLLPGTNGVINPFFSPDGRWVAFWRTSSNRLEKLPITGGEPVIIAAFRDQQVSQGGSWDASGLIVLSRPEGLVALAATGGEPRQITKAGTGETHAWPEVLPGARAVVFTVMSGPAASQSARLAAADLATGKVTLLDLSGMSPHYVTPGYLLYATPDGSLQLVPFDAAHVRVTGAPVSLVQGIVVKSSGAAGYTASGGQVLAYVAGSSRVRLILADRSGGLQTLTPELREYNSPRFSPDGHRVALHIGQLYPSDVWVLNLVSGTLSRLTFGGTNMYPAWLPDGRRLSFVSDREGPIQQLYSILIDGSGSAERVLSTANPIWEEAWSPDAQSLVYRASSPTTGRDIWYRSLRSDTTTQPVAATPFDERMPALSFDGRWVAYVSDESGRDEVYVRPVPPRGGGRWQVSADGGSQPVWARDGRELFYIHSGGLVAASVVLTPTFRVDTRRTLFTGGFLFGANQHANYDVSPDGNRFVMVASAPGEEPRVVVVLNWLQELRHR
jgi:serine/threonine-protein kinase